ncbi:rhodanese-like domain-containing protein [Kordiimonas lacus]|uniref:Rhodanese-related sulfurtransferase n=1 Tax=Kordiimonas lacus TaxID=637679 RepID=A0A1G7C955_9PROT|nr:rhodanese-like domain-containing protein [Kordiimonas lacus]SDE35912.1 Rhodanese-related sulfurtransferase [Kordiimonas lacus]
MSGVKTISAKAFKEAHEAGKCKTVIDVRTGAEYEACHVQGAQLFPLQDLKPTELLKAAGGDDAPLYMLCKAGGRAKKAAEAIAPHTERDVIVVEGGTDACVSNGLPVNTGKDVMSLERQVRITAGALVVLGVALSLTVAPGFVWLSAFVGAGLMFAGITDTCAMGMMLARMPWNKAKNA